MNPMTAARPFPCLLALAALAAACGGDNASQQSQDPNLFVARRDDLPITVRENAELQALRETIVRSEVEGQSTIIYIVPEGTLVKQGEKLIELDVSELVDKAANQEISVERALSQLEQARTQQEILEKELTTKKNTAASQLTIAGMELEKLLGAKSVKGTKGSEGKNADMVNRLRELVAEKPATPAPAANGSGNGTTANGTAGNGDPVAAAPSIGTVTAVDPRNYAGLVDRVVQLLLVVNRATPDVRDDPLERDMGDIANKILQQTDKIRLAMADLKVKEDTVGHSRRLAAKQFITRNELERDELAYQSQVSQVTIAWNDLELLVNYTLQTERIKLEQDLENAKLEFERVEASNDAERKKSTFDVDAKQKEYKVAKERFDNLRRQIDSAVVYAPTPGTVVYARIDRNRGGGDAVREGVQVRERQELIILPDTTKMRCIIKVQEAQVDKVTRGQHAVVTVEAFQGETFNGRVTTVAPVADSNSGWMTSDRKVYTTVVELDSENPDGRLRSRMAANVTIMVDTVKDTLPVPLQAVFRDRSVNYVWREGADGPVAVPIRAGRQNSERVEVLDGIREGDVLHLRTPAGVQPPKLEQPVVPAPPVKQAPEVPAAATTPANANGAANAHENGEGNPGNGGEQNGQRPNRRAGMGAMGKKLADMTPEELQQYKGMLAGMDAFVERLREGNAEKATEAETALAELRKAIDANDLAAAQVHKDKLGTLMRPSRPGGGTGGSGTGGNGTGGERGERGRRGNGGEQRPDRGN